MRHRLVHALIAAGSLAWCASAQAGTVVVAAEGREPETLDVAALQASWDVRDRPYTVAGATVTVSGISIDRLLDAAGVDPFRFSGATVAAGGRTIALARDHLIDPDAFPDGRPVFGLDPQGVSFLRPGGGDGSAGELLSAAELTVSLVRTSRLRVSVSAARTRIEAGDRVAFTATVDGAAAGEQVRVRWAFDDGSSGSGRQVAHRFRRPGTYKVVVGATSEADPAGASAVVTIRVGDPPEGPDREGGGTDPDANAPDSGAATGGTGRATVRRAETRGEPRRNAERRRAPRRNAEPRRAPRRRRQPEKRASEPAADRIEGVLLGVSESDPPPAGADRATRTGAPQAPEDGTPTIPPEALWATAVLGLLGLGAGLERPGRRRLA